jgi:Na+/proline symporter
MSVALISEYTAIGDLFEHYVGGPSRVYIILLVGLVTAIYTAKGGLLVSLLTDQLQAGLVLFLILIASTYLAVKFREPLHRPFPERLGVNYSGLSSIFSLPISLLSSACYQESFWQRVWSAEDKRSLRYGAALGFALTTVVIAFFGTVGWLGLLAELPPLDDHNNLAFFVPFSDAATGGSVGSMVIRVMLVVLVTTMNESAVDSLQNAIVSTLSSSFLKEKPVSWSRALVFVVNAPVS